MPWKNGQGTTRQFIIYPSTCTSVNDDFTFRLSSAQMKTQFHQQEEANNLITSTTRTSQRVPFSSFVGYSRVLIYTQCNDQTTQQKSNSPTQMYILQEIENSTTIQQSKDHLPMMVPYNFSGSVKTECELLSSETSTTDDEGEHFIIDYNVMTKDERAKCEKVVCHEVNTLSSEEINLLQLLDLPATSSIQQQHDDNNNTNQKKWHLFLYVPDDLDAQVKINIPKSASLADESIITLHRDDTLRLEGIGDYSQILNLIKVSFESLNNQQEKFDEKGGNHVICVLITEN